MTSRDPSSWAGSPSNSRGVVPNEASAPQITTPSLGTCTARFSASSPASGTTTGLQSNNAALLSTMANQLWHTDSSFMRTVGKYSMLSAAVVPARGGDTEFADLRAAWDALPDDLRALHDEAHHECYIANSIRADVTVADRPARFV